MTGDGSQTQIEPLRYHQVYPVVMLHPGALAVSPYLPAFLPDINPIQAENDQNKIERAFVVGLLTGRLRLVDTDQNVNWRFRNEEGISEKFLLGKKEAKNNFGGLFVALAHYPERVEKILEIYQAKPLSPQDFEERCRTLPELSGCKYPIVDAVFKMVEESSDRKAKDRTMALLDTLYEEICLFYTNTLGAEQGNTVQLKVAELINQMLQTSETYTKAGDEKWSAYEDWSGRISYLLTDD